VRLRELAGEYAAFLRSAFGDRLVSVVLYGSVARGDARPGADIEVLVVVDAIAPGPFKRRDLLDAADQALAPLIDAAGMEDIPTRLVRIVKSREEAREVDPLYLDLTQDAVLLYDRDGFFARILDGVRASLDRLGATRTGDGHAWYWETSQSRLSSPAAALDGCASRVPR
jgi:predicted nucleotidyltransferase